MSEIPTKFNFKEIENKWIDFWEENNLFRAQSNTKKNPYTIVIPPPNVTGILHMGHALNCTLQDIIIRYKRMRGFETLWMPGTDHAGIATQNVVEKDLAKKGKKRHDLGRDDFLKRLWDWKEKYGGTIIHQLKKLGSSCDWQRTCFTMDDQYSEAVRQTFVKLYEKGLIYRGEYIINWCPRCQTALSDEEVEHHETQGHLYHIRYPFKDNPDNFVVVATTRPETMLGDTAVAVNPKDKRYKNVINKILILPLVKREIQIISDEFVDPKFGTGAVKVTPAHDPNDFNIGHRHDLEFINIMNPDAVLNKHAGKFEGMDRFEARKAIIEMLREQQLLEKVEPHQHAVGHCYRCHTVVEPYLSKQWFVKMAPLTKPAIDVVKKGQIKFYPQRWTKVYLNWMENIRDWCISRQIWWGHRIPVWYCAGGSNSQPQCKEPIVSVDVLQKCPHCGSTNLKQDEDVLDTWFSSWLWPFATLRWPKENQDLNYFYPTSALFTASEIIFFWVARMIMAGLEFTGKIPFSDVYIHGTVRDAQGRKMSKSLGNALDPLKIIDEYGADALRFSLIINSGQDLYISKEKFEIGRNFANKVWNASRLIMLNTKNLDAQESLSDISNPPSLDLHHRWIISKFMTTLTKVNKSIESYRYSEAENLIYEFFWSHFCDRYLEIIKEQWDDHPTQSIALIVLKDSLKMMHPFIPFVTEEIWSKLHQNGQSLSVEQWPQTQKNFIDEIAEKQMSTILEIVGAIRNIRVHWNIKQKQTIPCYLVSSSKSNINLIEANKEIVRRLAHIEDLKINTTLTIQKDMAIAVVGKINCAIPLGNFIDVSKEKKRILTQIDDQKKSSLNLSKRLKNKNFVKKAPNEIVAKEKNRLKEIEHKIKELKKLIQNFK